MNRIYLIYRPFYTHAFWCERKRVESEQTVIITLDVNNYVNNCICFVSAAMCQLGKCDLEVQTVNISCFHTTVGSNLLPLWLHSDLSREKWKFHLCVIAKSGAKYGKRIFRPSSHRMRSTSQYALANYGTHCGQWECSHSLQATSKGLHKNLPANLLVHPV